ncbi:MAG: leucine-rich repeat protein [Oscillospiraceae bacterium]|nr:leucine-rich repeat protein [Oscillospiraceae bacterium]
MEILKRSLSAFLALVLVLGMIPVNAAAAEIGIAEAEATQPAVFETLADELPMVAAETVSTTAATEPVVELETPITGVVTVTGLNIRSGPDTTYPVVGSYEKNTVVTILRTKGTWGNSDLGWVNMTYLDFDAVPEETEPTEPQPEEPVVELENPIAGVVTVTNLYIRSGPDTTYDIIGTYSQNDIVTILRTKGTWGNSDLGWVNMTYLDFDAVPEETEPTEPQPEEPIVELETPITGVVATYTSLNIRSGPGTTYDVIGTYAHGDVVTILKTKGTWGCSDLGWVDMTYLDFDEGPEETVPSETPKLAAPTDLVWNKTVEYTGSGYELVTRMGAVAWTAVQPEERINRIEIINQGTGETVIQYTTRYGNPDTNLRSNENFILDALPSGTYYFTVTAVAAEGSKYADSEPAVSDPWVYVKPGTSLASCTDLKIEWPMVSWTNPAGFNENMQHQLEWYYGAELNQIRPVDGDRMYLGNSLQVPDHLIEEFGAGYYSFRIRPISDDITRICNGEWSSVCEPYYFDASMTQDEFELILQNARPHDEVELNGNLTLVRDLEIPELVSLRINGGSITVPDGITLTEYGIYLYNGKLTVQQGGKLNANGRIGVYNGSSFDMQGICTFGYRDYVELRYDSGSVSGTVTGIPKSNLTLSMEMNSRNEAYWDEMINLLENGDYGSRKLDIQNDFTLTKDLKIPASCQAVVFGDATLTIPEGITIRNKGTLRTNSPATICNNGTIETNSRLEVSGNLVNGETGMIDVFPGEDELSRLHVEPTGRVVNNGVINIYKDAQGGAQLIADEGHTWEGNTVVEIPFGSGIQWEYIEETATLRIFGKGRMPDYTDRSWPWAEHIPDIKRVVVENGVLNVGMMAFYQLPELEQVEMSDSVTNIAYAAFYNCEKLYDLEIPEELEGIGDEAFSQCETLEAVALPDTMHMLGGQAFYSCDNLKEVTFAGGLRYISDFAFAYCPELKSVVLPSEMTNFWSSAFEECISLKTIEIPDTVIEIGDYAFQNTGLERVSIPAGIQRIGYYAFAHNLETQENALTEIYFEGNAPAFDSIDFVGDVNTFLNVTANAYYPRANRTWTEDVRLDYGGDITWIPYGEEPEEPEPDNPTYPVPEILTLILHGENGRKEIAPETLSLDMMGMEPPVLTFTAQRGTEEVSATWKTSNAQIASVSGGFVQLKKPGTVTITAMNGTEKDAITLTVIYADPAAKLTAASDIPAIGLQQGQSERMRVYGENKEVTLAVENLIFTTSNAAVASVDETGLITGGSKPGTAKITAAIEGDPLKRKVTLNVKVIAAQVKELTLDPENVVLDKAALTTKESRSYVIVPAAVNDKGEAMTITSKNIKWTSSNTKLATVKANPDGSATVTIAANKDGEAVITAQANDLRKVTAAANLLVYDKAPKLASNKLTLNPMMLTGTDLGLIPGKWQPDAELEDNAIQTVTVMHNDLTVEQTDNGSWVLKAKYALKNSTIKTTLEVVCENGQKYYLDLSVTVKSTIPAITLKQSVKLDLFYKDSRTDVVATAKNAVVTELGLAQNGNIDFVMEDGVIFFSDGLLERFAANPKYKPNTKGTMLIHLEGYAHPVEKAVTIATTASKLTLTTDPTVSAVNVNPKFGIEPLVSFKLYNKAAKQDLMLTENDTVTVDGYSAEQVTVDYEKGTVNLVLIGSKKATLNVNVQKENWAYPVTLKHTVNVTDKDPTVKLNTATLTLNSSLAVTEDNLENLQIATTGAVVSTGNLKLTGFQISPAKANANTDLIEVAYNAETNLIEAFIKPGEIVPAPGTYTYNAYPLVENARLDKPLSLKITVNNKPPVVTVSTKDKIDAIDPDSRVTFAITKITNTDSRVEKVAIHPDETDRNGKLLTQGYLFALEQEGIPAVNDKGQQTFTLKLNPPEGEEVAKKAYKVVFDYTIGGKIFTSKPVNVTVTQGKLVIWTESSYVREEQDGVQKGVIDVKIGVTSPAAAQIELISINGSQTAKEIVSAYESGVLAEEIDAVTKEPTGNLILTIRLSNPNALIIGKTYKLVLNITPVGNTTGTKPTSVTVNIRPQNP